ncbi:MAG TPA: hypothetical protein VFZ44_01650 [Pyrinomonadaceae bacterium]
MVSRRTRSSNSGDRLKGSAPAASFGGRGLSGTRRIPYQYSPSSSSTRRRFSAICCHRRAASSSVRPSSRSLGMTV